jgi:hypothetical protein
MHWLPASGAAAALDGGWPLPLNPEVLLADQSITAGLHASVGADTLPAQGFSDLAFDEWGTLHVLTDSAGVFHHDSDGRWTPVTGQWPTPLAATGLRLRSGLAVVSTVANGVLLWDLLSGDVRMVPLE